MGSTAANVLDGPDAVRAIAARMPPTGVTAVSPTTIACEPNQLREVLAAVCAARISPDRRAARVLRHTSRAIFSARIPGRAAARLPAAAARAGDGPAPPSLLSFTGADIVAEIEHHAEDVGIITVAPEIDGALPLIRSLVFRGHRVSLGHSGASLEVGLAAIDAGARGATHLFNRMPPLLHASRPRGRGIQAGEVSASSCATASTCTRP